MKIYNDYKMFNAVSMMMCYSNNQNRKFKFNSKLYECVRIKLSKLKSKNILNNKKFKFLNVNGIMMSVKEVSDQYNITTCTIRRYLKKGIDINDIIKMKIRPRNSKYEYNGESHTIREWEDILHLKHGIIRHRMERGMDFHKAITFKSDNKHKKKFYLINNNKMSLDNICNTYNLSKTTIYRKLKEGLSIDEIIKLNPKKKNIKYFYNNEYLTLPEIAIKYHLNLNTLSSRIHMQKKSIKDAIELPI